MSNPYLPFPNDNSPPSNSRKSEKKNGSTIYNETLRSALKQKQQKVGSTSNASNNKIKYDIDANKSKSKLNQIIKDKINHNSTHNLVHNPSIQRHNKKSPQSVLKNHHKKKPINPDEKWLCSVCTYKNMSIMAYCEICETKKEIDNDNDDKQREEEKQEREDIDIDDNDDKTDDDVLDNDGDLSLSLSVTQSSEINDNTNKNEMEQALKLQMEAQNYWRKQTMEDEQIAKKLMMEESQSIPNYKKRSYSDDEEIARKLQEELNENKELQKSTQRQKQLEDEYLAKKLQTELEEQERALQRKKHEEDELMAKLLQQEHEEEVLKLEREKLENERAALALQAKEDMDAAIYYEKKQKEDEAQMRDDESFALTMQQELNKGAAWFCNACFQMNMNIKSYKCSLCDTKRPKPSIPKYIMSMRDDLSTKIMGAIREVPGSIVNITFVQNFVVKYFKMCEEIGYKLAYPKIVYHWTRSANFDPISKTGLKVPDGHKIRHQTDTGYYGRGIYTSPDPKYAQGYGHGANKLFVCLSLPGRQYKASYPAMLGKPLKEGYDSHISKDRNEMEWVFFTTEQLLLCYLVTLDFLEQKAKTQMDYVCQFLESKFLGMREEKLNKLTKDDV